MSDRASNPNFGPERLAPGGATPADRVAAYLGRAVQRLWEPRARRARPIDMTASLRWAISLAVLLAAAGCARTGPGSAPTGDPVPAFGPDDLVLQVAHVGGFRGMAGADDIPALSIYGDGRVITLGPQIEIYPPPALPNVQVAMIRQSDLNRLWDMAKAAKVGEKADFGTPNIADAMSTRFTLRTESGLVTTEVYALREVDADPALTADQVANRKRFTDLLDALSDLPKTLGEDAVSPSQAYAATAVAGLAREWVADPSAPNQAAIAWPGPALPGPPTRSGAYGCVTATGADAQAILSAAAKANAATPWTSGGKKWLVQIRPLLPHESSCADLTQ